MAKILFSPAKINLGLSILGRNEEEYHLLESIFLPLDFGDQIEVAPSKKNLVTVAWSESAEQKCTLPDEENNIVTNLLKNLSSSWEIKITKKIPLGAGLGGGSSNAGTLLRYFVSEKIVPAGEARTLARKLGADVSFFLNPTPSWVTGTGENCRRLEISREAWQNLHALLVLIPEHCDTRQVFTSYKNAKVPFSNPKPAPETEAELYAYMQSAVNDLEQGVMMHSPVISEVLSLLRSTTNKFCSLSGSGSTCFALYDSRKNCEISVKELSNSLRKIGCKTVIAKILHDGSQHD